MYPKLLQVLPMPSADTSASSSDCAAGVARTDGLLAKINGKN
jgi:hypothetical protein